MSTRSTVLGVVCNFAVHTYIYLLHLGLLLIFLIPNTKMMFFRLLVVSLPCAVLAQVITGKIVSCSGWALNRLPELKSFLKDGEAESYRGVQIEYISGRTAALSVFHDGVLHEDVQLTDIATKDLMHRLMLEKGFVKKSDAELAKERDANITQRQLDEINNF